MRGQAGFFDIDERLKELSAKGHALEGLTKRTEYHHGPAVVHALSRARLSDPVPDANTIWTFREAQSGATIDGKPAIEVLLKAYDAMRGVDQGRLPRHGQIIDASIVAAPKQRNTDGEKAEIKAGRVPEAWQDKPAELAPEGPRGPLEWPKAKPADDSSPRVDLAVPVFGYKNLIDIDRRHGLIRHRTTARHPLSSAPIDVDGGRHLECLGSSSRSMPVRLSPGLG